MIENTGRNEKTGLIGSGIIITLLTSLFIALIYTTGWSYAYHYFERFHLGLLALDIPREYFFLYGFLALKEKFFKVLFLFILVTVFVFGYWVMARRRISKNQRNSPTLTALRKSLYGSVTTVIILPAVTLLLFMTFYSIGSSVADSLFEKEVKSDFRSYPGVRVWLTTDAEHKTDAIAQEWQKGCYRLLMKNKENLYLFYPGQLDYKLPTEVIPSNQVRYMRILPQYHTHSKCRE